MKRSLGWFDVLCLGLNAIVGSGIFLLPDDLYREMGIWSPLAFVACGVGLLPVALCYAVAAKNHDQTGGPYLYARDAFGPRVAFAVGFTAFVTGVLSFAAVAAAAAASLGRLVPSLGEPVGLWCGAAVGIVFFSALNYRGARPGALTIDAFTVAKFGVLFVLIVTLWPTHGAAPAGPLAAESSLGLPRGPAGVGAAVFMAVFAAQGFEVVGVPAGESRAPGRHVPLGVLGSLLLASLLYVIVQWCLVSSYDRLALPSDTPLADAALAKNAGLGLLIAVGGLVSTWGFVSGTALGTPRYLFALSRDGHLPAQLAAVHERFGSPKNAIVLTAGLSLLLVTFFDYRSLIGMSNVTIAAQYLTTCLAVAKLGRGRDGAAYGLPGGWLLPLLGSLMSLWIFSEASLVEFAWVGATLSLGALGLVVTKHFRRDEGRGA